MSISCLFGIHDWKQNCEQCASCGRMRNLLGKEWHSWVRGKCSVCGTSCAERLARGVEICVKDAMDEAISRARDASPDMYTRIAEKCIREELKKRLEGRYGVSVEEIWKATKLGRFVEHLRLP